METIRGPRIRVKKKAIKRLYHAAQTGRKQVVCVDEFGPLELRPQPGRSWQRRQHPTRQRATYTRYHGVRHLFAAYDVKTGHLWGRIRKRKRAQDFLAFLKQLRQRYRGELWIILDNLSAHKTPEVLRWAERHRIRFQWLPTNASWLNRIECHFTPLKKNVLTCCDYDSFPHMQRAIHRYLHWRNKQKTSTLSQKRH